VTGPGTYRRVAMPTLAIVTASMRPQRIPCAEREAVARTDAMVAAAREAAEQLIEAARVEAGREVAAAQATAQDLLEAARREADDYAERFRATLRDEAAPTLRDLLADALRALGAGPEAAGIARAALRHLADRGLLPRDGELRTPPEAVPVAEAFATETCPVVGDPGLLHGAVVARSAAGEVAVDLLSALRSDDRRDAAALGEADRFLDLGAQPTPQES
jgi:vacuolar-type H+-ATPase subunit H